MTDTYILRWIEIETNVEHEETFDRVFGRTYRQEEIVNILKIGHCFINHNDGTLPEYQYSFFNINNNEIAASILGSIKTEKKARSSAENGKKGGRPRK